MGKFKVDEIAIFVGGGARYPNTESIARYLGQEVTVIDPLGSDIKFGTPRYGIKMQDGAEAWVTECALRKRPQPGLDHFRSELKSADPSLWPPGIDLDRLRNPALTEPVVREGLKGILQPFDNFYEGCQ